MVTMPDLEKNLKLSIQAQKFFKGKKRETCQFLWPGGQTREIGHTCTKKVFSKLSQ